MRPKIESVTFEFAHCNGARHCYKRGVDNANWCCKICATAYDIKNWMRPHPNKALLQEIEDITTGESHLEMKDVNHKKL